MASDPRSLQDVFVVLDRSAADGKGNMTVGEMLDVFADRSFGALLTLIALLACIPVISAIPGFSILTGSLLILTAAQYLAGRRTPWFPERLRNFSVSRETLRRMIKASRPYAAWIDRWVRPRLTVLTKTAVTKTLIAIAVVLLAVSFYPLALIPGGVTPPALSIIALGLALIARDGVLALIGLVGLIATAVLIAWAFL